MPQCPAALAAEAAAASDRAALRPFGPRIGIGVGLAVAAESSTQTQLTLAALTRPKMDPLEALLRAVCAAASREEAAARAALAAEEVEGWADTMRAILEDIAALIAALMSLERRARGLVAAAFAQYTDRMELKARKLLARHEKLARREAAARLVEEAHAVAD